MKSYKIKNIQKRNQKRKAYDIHHKINPIRFDEKHPNLILNGMICHNCSRHAGGVIISENINEKMPLISNKGTIQSPWTEGTKVKHLEKFGFIKFDILGLKTLRMIQNASERILERHFDYDNPEIEDIRQFYNEKLHPDSIKITQDIFEEIYHKGKWVGIFQFTESGVQDFCEKVKPESFEELVAITSIYRPGPMNAGVDDEYIENKRNPEDIEYEHPIIEDVLGETYGHCIYQEQIMQLVHRLGKNITLDEGDLLRKILTKRGLPEKKKKKKESIKNRFFEGCEEKGVDGEKLWDMMKGFAEYGFNKSHAAAYISVSLQCAWLMYHYPEEWTAAYLDAQGENKKEHAISVARNAGFEIAPPDINHSTDKWLIKDSETLVQPLTDVKKCGQKAYEQIKEHRPFEDPERVVLDDDIDHRPLSKNVVGNLIKVGALDELIENKEQINGRKHLWASLVEDKPSSEKMYNENLEEYDSLSDFQKDTQIEYDLDLTGVYPYDKILQDEVLDKLGDMGVERITEFESDQEQEAVVWFVVHEVREEIASSGNKYWVLDVSDNSGQKTDIRCWSPKEYEEISENCAYLGKLDYDPKWGFSCNSIYHNIEEI